jgi:PAS domain S-box-containing protein
MKRGGWTAFEQLADNCRDGVWACDGDLRCLYWNGAIEEITGLPVPDVIGYGIAEILSRVTGADEEAVIRRVLAGERVVASNRRFTQGPGDRSQICETRTFPVRSPDGEVVGAAAVVRRNLEESLLAAVEARDDFLSVASHELSTPLMALQLHVDRLQHVLKQPPASSPDLHAVAKRADSIEEQLKRLTELIETLLDATHVTARDWRLELEPLDLGPLVDRVVRRLKPVAEKALCPVAFQSCPSLVGRWDPGRLEQVVTNLLSNALKFGAGKPVEVTVLGDGSTARVRVRDQGIGIERGQEAVIFERFGSAALKRKYPGLGLGLWIARQVVEAMGGRIEVQSAPGEGATFEVVLPRGLGTAKGS